MQKDEIRDEMTRDATIEFIQKVTVEVDMNTLRTDKPRTQCMVDCKECLQRVNCMSIPVYYLIDIWSSTRGSTD